MYFKVLCLFHRGDSIPAKLRGSHLVCGRRKRIKEVQKIFWKILSAKNRNLLYKGLWTLDM